MQTIDILRQHEIGDSFRVAQVRGQFGIDNKTVVHRFQMEIELPADWKIGLIIGASGSGKTTLAREMFDDDMLHNGFRWKAPCFLDDFPVIIESVEIFKALNSVGFSSPPQWLLPFASLSGGQKFRAELARILATKKSCCFDEFTSFVDRDVAKITCAALRKHMDKTGGFPFVGVSCHYDIADWLEPDWIIDVSAGTFESGRLRRRPIVEIKIHRCDKSMWGMFRRYHYLDHDINKAAQCYVATWGGRPVAFCSVLHFPHASTKLFKREHRTVVLPDFQGLGIGNRLSDFVAAHYTRLGFRFISTTSNPAMIWARHNSSNWRITRFGHTSRSGRNNQNSISKTLSSKRKTASFEYVGEK